jgi:hypothetical protein
LVVQGSGDALVRPSPRLDLSPSARPRGRRGPLLAAPLSASTATTRYAAPTGTGPSPCVASEPCSIETALSATGPEGLGFFDTVLLAPGTYSPTGGLKVENAFVTVAGEPGRPAPLIEAAAAERGLFFPTVGTVRALTIHSTSATHFGLVLNGQESVAEGVESTGEATVACSLVAASVRNTLCASSAMNGEGLAIGGAGGSEPWETNLYDVTAIGAIGINAFANGATVKLGVVNTIARGTTFDLVANSQSPPTSSVEVELSHSNFAVPPVIGGAEVTAPTENGNQSAAPIFVDEAGGDYREAEGSPTRLAGDLGVVLPGEVDLAGNSRTTNCAGTVGVDIGAYQFECPPPPPVVTLPAKKRSPKTCTRARARALARGARQADRERQEAENRRAGDDLGGGQGRGQQLQVQRQAEGQAARAGCLRPARDGDRVRPPVGRGDQALHRPRTRRLSSAGLIP